MTIEHDIPLARYTTFGIGGNAEYFVSVTSEAELEEACDWAGAHEHPVTLLGGGSNVLIGDAGIRGLVIKNDIKGTQHVGSGGGIVCVIAGAGEDFDAIVSDTVAESLWGLENLSMIPGSVGATPIQNVGAYGVEVGDVITQVRVYDTAARSFEVLSASACKFSYRDSIFKRTEGSPYIVTEVTFALTSVERPQLAYKDLREYFADGTPTLAEIRNAVVAIRSQKFPDWHSLGTAGSFFKNPVVSSAKFEALREQFPELPGFKVRHDEIKISLAWIFDHVLGLKGMRDGNVGMYEGHALVLVNHGGATAHDIEMFAQKIIDMVHKKIGVIIEWEVSAI